MNLALLQNWLKAFSNKIRDQFAVSYHQFTDSSKLLSVQQKEELTRTGFERLYKAHELTDYDKKVEKVTRLLDEVCKALDEPLPALENYRDSLAAADNGISVIPH